MAKVLAPGTVVANRYRLDARLGAGGGGTVWRCYDQQLAMTVALKIVASDGDLERWRREVAMSRRIADRHVCRVHDLGEAGDLRFVTMELVAGDSLRTKIGPDLDARTARELFAQVVAGAAAIHAAGVVHRDLKPENVVVGDGRAVIVDFGLAREPATATSAPSVTISGAVVGTPRYMAPEQAIGATADARSDVWAHGLVGHELLAGKLPALAEGGLAIASEVERKWPGISPVLRRCIALEPADRYPDARALAAALAALSPRRGRRLALIAGVLAVAAIAAVAIVAGRLNRSSTRSSTAAAVARDAAPDAIAAAGSAAPIALEPIGPAQKRWPQDAPASVLLSRDGKRYATTTVAADQLVIRNLDDSQPETRALPKDVATARAIGWFGDDSIAVMATTREGTYELHRIDKAGKATSIHRAPLRFAAAIGPRDEIVIGHQDGIWLLGATAPTALATTTYGESIAALAWSPDGSRLAVARVRDGEPGAIQIRSATAVSTARDVFTGTFPPDLLLAWLDDKRLAFTIPNPTETTLFVADTTQPVPAVARASFGELVGPGSAASGTLLVLRTVATDAVQVGDADAEELSPAIANVPTSRLAGWTADGRLVLAAGTPPQIVRAEPGASHEPWPGTTPGLEIPDTVAGDSVIAHRIDAAASEDHRVVVERIDAAGRKHELLRLHATRGTGTVVRCAGDHTPPCLLHNVAGTIATWYDLDPETGERGRIVHSRGGAGHDARDLALSLDGALFAVVAGTSELTVYDRATAMAHSYRATDDTAFDALGFAPNGDIWAGSTGFRDRRFGLVRFTKSKSTTSYFAPTGKGSSYRDALRKFARPSVSPDGKRVAAEVREFRVTIARLRL